jgi:branched-chain amino acid transport system substrate-binding protein
MWNHLSRVRGAVRRGFLFLPCAAIIGTIIFQSGCGGRAAPEPIRIGLVAPLSGSDKDAGEHARNGVLLALDEANVEEGIVAGRKLSVDFGDTRSDKAAVRGVTMRLLSLGKSAGLLGAEELAQVESLDAVAQTYTVPMVVSATPPPRSAGGFVFYTGLPPAQQGQTLAQFASGELKSPTVALLYHVDAAPIADAFARNYSGDKLLGRWSYITEKDSKDKLKAAAEEVKKKGAAAVVFAGPAGDLSSLVPTALGDKTPILYAGQDGWTGRWVPGGAFYAVSAFAAEDPTPAMQEFVAKYQKRFNEPPDAPAGLTYDNARILVEAMRNAGSIDGKKLKEAVAELQFKNGLTGPLRFGSERQAIRAAFVVEWKDGKPQMRKRYEPEEKVARLAADAAAR